MELFATDRDRLAFLLETDAALDLDFEALEAQAQADAGTIFFVCNTYGVEPPLEVLNFSFELGIIMLALWDKTLCGKMIDDLVWLKRGFGNYFS